MMSLEFGVIPTRFEVILFHVIRLFFVPCHPWCMNWYKDCQHQRTYRQAKSCHAYRVEKALKEILETLKGSCGIPSDHSQFPWKEGVHQGLHPWRRNGATFVFPDYLC